MIKKIILILSFSILCANITCAQTQNAYLDYNGFKYDFKPGDEIKFHKNADLSMHLFEIAKTTSDRIYHLQNAMRYYFLLLQINPKSLDAQIGLARIYDELKLDRLAKKYFFSAFNMEGHNPKTNLYFANFYYKRNDLVSALYYYKRAYQNGYQNSFYLNFRLGAVYEKLADLEAAKKFYQNAMILNSYSPELGNKIRLLDELNYSQSQYYLFKETEKRKLRDK